MLSVQSSRTGNIRRLACGAAQVSLCGRCEALFANEQHDGELQAVGELASLLDNINTWRSITVGDRWMSRRRARNVVLRSILKDDQL